MAKMVDRLAPKGVTHAADMPTLRIDGVSVSFASGSNGVTTSRKADLALQNVSFEVHKGERVAVVGPNGAGKSTLLRLIAGMLKPGKGQVNIYGHGPDDHICIAFVPQRNKIDWSFPATVEDVVMMGRVGRIGLFRWPGRADWEVVKLSLERVQARDLAKRQVWELSGGQQQRVFIARALAQEAEILLMDEPLTGLDVPSQEAIFAILDGLRAKGVTVLVATHDLNMAGERFDQVMLINKRVIAYGQATDVLTASHLLHAYGGYIHKVGDEDALLLADTGCGHGEED